MIKEILLTLFYLFLFNFLLYRFRKFQFKSFKPVVTHLLFNLKFVVGIFIWFIYTFYYKDVQNNDVHKFYTDALVLRQTAAENPKAFLQLLIHDNGTWNSYTAPMKNWKRNFDEAPFNENQTIIKLNTLLLFVSFNTYFVHILFFCFISLIGWVLLTNSILGFVDARNSILALPVLFLPSVLFWTSGVMKEPLLVLGLGLTISGILNCELKIADLKNILKVLLGFVLILFTKFFVLACLLPPVIAYLLFNKKEDSKFILLKYITVFTLSAFFLFSIHSIVPSIHPMQMLVNKQTHSVKEAAYFKAGSRIEIPQLSAHAGSVLKAAPVGVWNTLLRPYPFETKNVMMLMSALENFFIIAFLLTCLTFINWRANQNLNLFLFLLCFSLSYFALVGMCTPVLGNLVRYKTPLFPVFMFAFLVRVSPHYVANTLSFVLRK